jgi:hypothetical protein
LAALSPEGIEIGRYKTMASSGKRKTTMAKLNRERKVLEKRQEKEARKVMRKRATADGLGTEDLRGNNTDDDVRPV